MKHGMLPCASSGPSPNRDVHESCQASAGSQDLLQFPSGFLLSYPSSQLVSNQAAQSGREVLLQPLCHGQTRADGPSSAGLATQVAAQAQLQLCIPQAGLVYTRLLEGAAPPLHLCMHLRSTCLGHAGHLCMAEQRVHRLVTGQRQGNPQARKQAIKSAACTGMWQTAHLLGVCGEAGCAHDTLKLCQEQRLRVLVDLLGRQLSPGCPVGVLDHLVCPVNCGQRNPGAAAWRCFPPCANTHRSSAG